MTQVRYISHASLQFEKKFQHTVQQNKIFCLDRDEEKQEKLGVGIEYTEGQQEAENGAGSADCGGKISRPRKNQINDIDGYACADTGEKIVKEEAPASPFLFNGNAENEKGVHVEKDVGETSVKEHVGDDLPQVQIVGHAGGGQGKVFNYCPVKAAAYYLQCENKYIRDDDFYYNALVALAGFSIHSVPFRPGSLMPHIKKQRESE